MKMETIQMILVMWLVIESVGRVVAKWTATKKDDEFFAKLDKAKDFVRSHSKGFFAIVETLNDVGIIKDTDGKIKEFEKQLNEAYLKVNGEALPEPALQEAKTIASGLAAMDKLGKKSLAPQVTASAPAVEISEQE